MSDSFPGPEDQADNDTNTPRRLPVDGNVAGRLSMVASLAPGAIAIAEPDGPPQPDGLRSYSLTTFGSLDQRSDDPRPVLPFSAMEDNSFALVNRRRDDVVDGST